MPRSPRLRPLAKIVVSYLGLGLLTAFGFTRVPPLLLSGFGCLLIGDFIQRGFDSTTWRLTGEAAGLTPRQIRTSWWLLCAGFVAVAVGMVALFI
jgi:hypothetical protein